MKKLQGSQSMRVMIHNTSIWKFHLTNFHLPVWYNENKDYVCPKVLLWNKMEIVGLFSLFGTMPMIFLIIWVFEVF